MLSQPVALPLPDALPEFPPRRVGGLAAACRRRWVATAVLADVVAIALGSAAAATGTVLAQTGAPQPPWALAFAAASVFLLCGRGVYRFRLRSSLLDDLAQVLRATTTAAALIITLRVLVHPAAQIGSETVRSWAFVSVYLAVARFGLSLSRGGPVQPGLRTLIIGCDRVGQLLARRLLERPHTGLQPVGFLDSSPPTDGDGQESIPFLGAPDDLERQVRAHDISHVVIGFCNSAPADMLMLAQRCRALGLGVSVVPRLYEQVTSRTEVDHLGGLPLLQVHQSDPRGWQFTVKYLLDRVLAAVALVILAPPLLVVAAAVKLTSPGPVLYRQRRVGLDGQEFEILKFRTMTDAGDRHREPGTEAAAAMLQLRSQDDVDRRTPLGRWLRRLSIDELPQLLNVLRGEMSFIGPRPERPSLAATFEHHIHRYGDRHRVKSGITGWAQVHGLRGKSSLSDRIEWDNYYIENWTPWLDVKIALLTIPALVAGRNAE
ncbi:MAG TPA: exopolysaccharide biosynthesis polyprenyl glycosylphosphotransferase [Acidimicrobiales bacterium]|nr:exopolysaccharide biosynthesis polyprenyl glycosylphosphotransferase [Acidimicrobiales bacterium]